MRDSLHTLISDMIDAALGGRTWLGRPMSRRRLVEEEWGYWRASLRRLQQGLDPNLGPFTAHFFRLLKLCPMALQGAFEDRWEVLNLTLTKASASLPGRRSWEGLARAMILTGSWPPRAHEVSGIVADVVEATRIREGEKAALSKALVLARAAFATLRTGGLDRRLTLLSFMFPALDLAGVLGHGRSLLLLQRLLTALHAEHPGDDLIARLRFDCDAIVLSHFGPRTRQLLRDAAAAHHAEMLIVERHKADRYLGQEWPIVYRGGLGAHYNFINTKVRLGEITSDTNPIFRQYRETTQLMNERSQRRSHEVVDGRVLEERDPFLARLRGDMLLQRDRRLKSLRGGKPREAIDEVERVLRHHAASPYLSQLEAASLLALRAEGFLCCWSASRRVPDWDMYWESKMAALDAARTAFDRGDPPRWVARLRSLERVAKAS